MPDHLTTKLTPHNCHQCNKEFFAYKSSNRLYCSKSCYQQAKKKTEICICPICGKSFESPIYRHTKYCSNDCCNIAKRKWHEYICKQCNKPFSVPTWRRKDNPTWCSNACRREWEKAENKTPRTRICPQCNKGFIEKSTDKRHYCSYECANNAKRKPKITVQCEVCGKLKDIAPNKLKRFRFCSAECRWIWTTLNMPKVSSIELLMAEAFDKAGMTPKSQYVIGPFVADFAFPNEKLIVECDGDYWHSLPNVQKKDRMKNHYYWENGWKVLHLWEHEINTSPADCVKRVQAKLQSLTP